MDIEQILDKIGDKLHNYLTIKLGSHQDAEDVLQEVFYRILKYRVRLKLMGNPCAYLFKIARNQSADHIKKRRNDRDMHRSNENISQAIRESLEGPDPEKLVHVSDALAQISEDQREVIVLKFFSELTFKETAQVCGISIGTVTSRYRYGMHKLRKIMEQQDAKY